MNSSAAELERQGQGICRRPPSSASKRAALTDVTDARHFGEVEKLEGTGRRGSWRRTVGVGQGYDLHARARTLLPHLFSQRCLAPQASGMLNGMLGEAKTRPEQVRR